MNLRFHIAILLTTSIPLSVGGISFDSFIKPFKKAGENIESNWKALVRDVSPAVNTAFNAVADRFKDTKLTRSADYSVRIAALYSARKTAELALAAAKKITEGTLNSSIDSLQLGLTAGDAFLADVVAHAGPELLSKTAQTGEGFLEGVKVSGVAVVSGGSWVAQNIMGQFDINEITYRGSLKGLERGILGGVNIQGRILGAPFTTTVNLDPKDVSHSFAAVAVDLGNQLKRSLYDPLIDQSAKTTRTIAETRINAEEALKKSPPPAIIQAGATLRSMNTAVEEYTALQARLQTELDGAAQQLEKAVADIISKSTQELKELIAQQSKRTSQPASSSTQTVTTQSSILARQELARRLLS